MFWKRDNVPKKQKKQGKSGNNDKNQLSQKNVPLNDTNVKFFYYRKIKHLGF